MLKQKQLSVNDDKSKVKEENKTNPVRAESG